MILNVSLLSLTHSWVDFSFSSSHPQVLSLSFTPFEMWLVVVSVPLLPAIIMVSGCYRAKFSALCHRALGWALRLVRGTVCVRSTHAFVFSNCTHGRADSVLETFDLYAETHPSLCIGPQIGQYVIESQYDKKTIYCEKNHALWTHKKKSLHQ